MKNPAHPGRLVASAIEAEGWTSTHAAERLGVTRAFLSGILHGHAGITAATALRLEALGRSNAEQWMRMQASHDLIYVSSLRRQPIVLAGSLSTAYRSALYGRPPSTASRPTSWRPASRPPAWTSTRSRRLHPSRSSTLARRGRATKKIVSAGPGVGMVNEVRTTVDLCDELIPQYEEARVAVRRRFNGAVAGVSPSRYR